MMKYKHLIKTFTVVLFGALLCCCTQDNTYKATLESPSTYQNAMQQLTDAIVYDIFSPPVASRIYAYANVAGYEVLAQNFPNRLHSLSGQLNEFTAPPKPNEEINVYLASYHAFMKICMTLTFSEKKLIQLQKQFYEHLEVEGLPQSLKSSSIEYGELIASHVLSWASKDNYIQTRSYPKHTVKTETRYWKPTPPDYMEGIEPHWSKIRPMVIQSANQFKPVPPEEFSMEQGSGFYQQLYQVYDVGVNLDEEQTSIAKFWDCNPYVSTHVGHAMFASKKITPGGHWMGITSISTKQENDDFIKTVEAFTKTSISLFDAFISCWDEKWRSLLVRPETLINQYLDEEWKPLLQTPPFPEYTSGHSVISRAAAITLTDIYGPNFAFHDTTEVAYGLPPRDFSSFLQASEEAAISRLYGGIHYMMAIENGVAQGEQVGKYIVEHLKTAVE